jgi:hypothetical protein
MRKIKANVSGIGAVAALVGIVILVAIVLVVVDVATTPSPPKTPQDTCTLVHHMILPDACVCSNPKGQCFPTETRPYLIFWTQAAACPTLGCAIDLRNR